MPARRRPSRGRSARADQSQQLRRYWDNHARSYVKQMALWERRLLGVGRAWVCAQATGEVLGVAIGTGRNLPSTRRASG
jgi:hypothetical protein